MTRKSEIPKQALIMERRIDSNAPIASVSFHPETQTTEKEQDAPRDEPWAVIRDGANVPLDFQSGWVVWATPPSAGGSLAGKDSIAASSIASPGRCRDSEMASC